MLSALGGDARKQAGLVPKPERAGWPPPEPGARAPRCRVPAERQTAPPEPHVCASLAGTRSKPRRISASPNTVRTHWQALPTSSQCPAPARPFARALYWETWLPSKPAGSGGKGGRGCGEGGRGGQTCPSVPMQTWEREEWPAPLPTPPRSPRWSAAPEAWRLRPPGPQAPSPSRSGCWQRAPSRAPGRHAASGWLLRSPRSAGSSAQSRLPACGGSAGGPSWSFSGSERGAPLPRRLGRVSPKLRAGLCFPGESPRRGKGAACFGGVF